ncbi:MAG: hypothetical protein J2P23_05150 [Microlunatus sp.]|nr:hypothetical protein [Microlunatus sp.]
MSARSSDLLVAAVVLTYAPDVDLLSFSVHSDRVDVADSPVGVAVIELHAHVGGWRDAELVAEALSLPEVERYRMFSYDGAGEWAYRRWVGWFGAGPLAMPVSVEVVAGEYCETAEPGESAEQDAAADRAADSVAAGSVAADAEAV